MSRRANAGQQVTDELLTEWAEIAADLPRERNQTAAALMQSELADAAAALIDNLRASRAKVAEMVEGFRTTAAAHRQRADHLRSSGPRPARGPRCPGRNTCRTAGFQKRRTSLEPTLVSSTMLRPMPRRHPCPVPHRPAPP